MGWHMRLGFLGDALSIAPEAADPHLLNQSILAALDAGTSAEEGQVVA